MNNFYDFDIIPPLLEKFKISRIILSGLSDENFLQEKLQNSTNQVDYLRNYISLEFHYIYHRFSENLEINEKYFNRNSKKKLELSY